MGGGVPEKGFEKAAEAEGEPEKIKEVLARPLTEGDAETRGLPLTESVVSAAAVSVCIAVASRVERGDRVIAAEVESPTPLLGEDTALTAASAERHDDGVPVEVAIPSKLLNAVLVSERCEDLVPPTGPLCDMREVAVAPIVNDMLRDGKELRDAEAVAEEEVVTTVQRDGDAEPGALMEPPDTFSLAAFDATTTIVGVASPVLLMRSLRVPTVLAVTLPVEPKLCVSALPPLREASALSDGLLVGTE